MIEYRKKITRQMLKDEPDVLYCFGDNLAEEGMGGQAKEMRGEPNAVGIPTKRKPSMDKDAFFENRDYREWYYKSLTSIHRLLEQNDNGGKIVWPEDDIGTGMAQLPDRAPHIYEGIQRIKRILEGSDDSIRTVDDAVHANRMKG